MPSFNIHPISRFSGLNTTIRRPKVLHTRISKNTLGLTNENPGNRMFFLRRRASIPFEWEFYQILLPSAPWFRPLYRLRYIPEIGWCSGWPSQQSPQNYYHPGKAVGDSEWCRYNHLERHDFQGDWTFDCWHRMESLTLKRSWPLHLTISVGMEFPIKFLRSQ